MQTKAKSVFVPLAALGVAAAFIWPGCAPLPLRSQHIPFSTRLPQDFAFAKSPQIARKLTRSDVIEKVGQPDAYFSDLRVACYRLDTVVRRRLWLFLFVLPVNVEHFPDRYEVAYIRYDENNNVVRAEVVTEMNSVSFAVGAKNWAKKVDKNK